jgi:hypothetical protein
MFVNNGSSNTVSWSTNFSGVNITVGASKNRTFTFVSDGATWIQCSDSGDI